MPAAAPVYLWNTYATKRHIKIPDDTTTHNGDPMSLCKFFFETREEQERKLKKWNTAEVATILIAKLDTVPLCIKCQKAAIKLGIPLGGSMGPTEIVVRVPVSLLDQPT